MSEPKVSFLNEGDRYLDILQRKDYESLMICGIPVNNGAPLTFFTLHKEWTQKDLMAAIGLLDLMRDNLIALAVSGEGEVVDED